MLFLLKTPMPLAPEFVEFLKIRAAAALPEVWQAPVRVSRAGTYGRVDVAGIPEEIFSLTNRFIPGPTSDLPIRIYRPTNSQDAPAIVYFHGGGWVVNFIDIYDAGLTALANRTGSVIIAVSYQKAPEHPYPIPFDDCYAAFLWTHENAKELGINAKKIGVSGDSAGGNLAAAVALKARDANGPSIAYQFLIYPGVGRDLDTSTYKSFETGFGLSRHSMEWFWQQYLQGTSHDQDPYAVPMSAKSFVNLPPTITITAEFDPLKDDGVIYDKVLREAKVKTYYKDYAGMIHGFLIMGSVTKTADIAITECSEWILEILNAI